MKDYKIIDDGDEIQVHLMMDGQKVGAAQFPEDVGYDAGALARQLGEAWKALP